MAGPGGRGVKPADWLLLAGDETALPAIARVLESLPASAEGVAIVELQRARDRIELSRPDGVEVRWLQGGDGGQSLAAAVKAVEVPRDRTRFLWAGAEFDQIQSIRGFWRDGLGIDKAEQLAVAYWRKGVSDAA